MLLAGTIPGGGKKNPIHLVGVDLEAPENEFMEVPKVGVEGRRGKSPDIAVGRRSRRGQHSFVRVGKGRG